MLDSLTSPTELENPQAASAWGFFRVRWGVMNAMEKADSLLARQFAGPGKDAKDDGLGAPLKMKSVPNVSTERLNRANEFYHASIHTSEGLHDFDGPRRNLIETGMKNKTITHELSMRGQEPGECKHCWGGK